MSYRIQFTHSASADLDNIAQWIARNDSVEQALHVLKKIEEKVESLQQNPQRGVFPPELRALGLKKYREVFFKPYRVIYQVRARTVIIHLVADGRRDMSALLQRRLID
ncbi:MAG: type II toxin-antitoxin system RelE/ParE family toxin [Xanthomonadales bacterium]|nr:type II toxin-antitoxin system RelE/ParE family toxin [Xanthomonadales bacterium]